MPLAIPGGARESDANTKTTIVSGSANAHERPLQKFVEAAQAAIEREAPPAGDLKARARTLARHCAEYRRPSALRASWQLASTIVPFAALLALMIWLGDRHYWLTMLLAIPLGGLLVRFFIIQHDCGHGSFFASRRMNDLVGRCMSVLTVTPYGLWRRVHAQHHATSGNLDRRGAGDIVTLTVQEYMALTRLGRLRYRIYRNPLFLFLVGVPAFFLLLQRVPWGHPMPIRESWKSVFSLDAMIIAVYGLLGLLISFKLLLLIALPAIVVASAIGGWLFFVQHQFEETHWESMPEWDFQIAAIHGSSYYELPAVLNWFTGNIGLHHIHHLNSMIPNYRLKECLAASNEFKSLNRLTLFQSFKCARLSLWCEERRRLIGFGDLERRRG